MSNIVLSCNPIQLIASATESGDAKLHRRFMEQIEHLYQYRIFKPLLDLVATKIQLGQLKFRVHDSRFFDLDAGNCKTIASSEGVFDGFLRKVRIRRQYCITIKKIASEVIIHEMAHMLEQEIGNAFNLSAFTSSIVFDIQNANTKTANPSLRQAINHIFVQQVEHYPSDQRNSELFARFFQIFAAAKELEFSKAEGYSYNLVQAASALELSVTYVNRHLDASLHGIVNKDIANASLPYIREVEDVQVRWADRRAQSIHGAHADSGSKWSKAVKSIKDDPFK